MKPFLSIQFRGIQNIHNAVHSPLSSSKIFSSPQKESPYQLNKSLVFLPYPFPRQPLIGFLALCICPFLVLHTNRIIQCVNFCVQLLLLSIMFYFVSRCCTLIDFHMLNLPCIPGINSTQLCGIIHVIFMGIQYPHYLQAFISVQQMSFLCCQIQLASILLRNFRNFTSILIKDSFSCVCLGWVSG